MSSGTFILTHLVLRSSTRKNPVIEEEFCLLFVPYTTPGVHFPLYVTCLRNTTRFVSSGSRLGWPDPWNKQAEMGSLAERATQVGTVSNTAMLQAPRIFRCKMMWTSPLLRYFQSRVWSSFVPSSNQCSWQDSLLSYHGKIKTGSTQGYGDSKDGISTAVLATSLIGWSNKKSPCQSTNLLSGLTALVFSAA